eukprot:1156319-Pelagomonas_calceolata.AAC.18
MSWKHWQGMQVATSTAGTQSPIAQSKDGTRRHPCNCSPGPCPPFSAFACLVCLNQPTGL